jgi:hypothetical protein
MKTYVITVVGATVGALLVFFGYDFVMQNMGYAPLKTLDPQQVATSTQTQQPSSQHTVTNTYTSEKYAFSINYPCDEKCQSTPPVPTSNAYVEDDIWFNVHPVGQITIAGFTDEMVDVWNTSIFTGDVVGSHPFPFSLDSMRTALQLPVGSQCEITAYPSLSFTHGPCEIVQVGNGKAVRIVNGVFKGTFPNRVYFLNPHGDNHWITLTELYTSKDAHDVWFGNASTTLSILEDQATVMQRVLDTLHIQ